ncbi:thioredoxin domain-containing protein [Winogradskyella sp.]|nr:thioredoxin domain-containing protein [Winogradskyella sp.]
MIKILKNIIWAVALYIVYIISGYIFGNHSQMLVLVTIATFFITLLYYKSQPNKKLLIGFATLIVPILAIFISISLFSGFKRSLVYIIFLPIVFYLSWLFVKGKKRLLVVIGLIVTIAFAHIFFIPNIYSYYLNFDSTQNKPFPELVFSDHTQSQLNLPKDKIVVLDFWTTSCGVCFTKFPEFEKLFLEYKKNPKIEFYSVNAPLKRDDFLSTLKIVDSLDYKYKTIYASSVEDMQAILNIQAYPEFMIIKNNQIRFSGYLNTKFNIVAYNTKNIIEKLLDE